MKAPTFQVNLGGEVRTLEYAFLAFEALGLSPFRPKDLGDFLGADESGKPTLVNFNPRRAAEWVRAGLLWEYVEDGPRAGQKPPSVETVMAKLDAQTFLAIFHGSIEAAGMKSEEGGSDSTADPQTAQTSKPSGQ